MNRTPLFELGTAEIGALYSAFVSLGVDEVAGDCLWLKVEPSRRCWAVHTRAGRFDFTVYETAENTSPSWLAVSERVIRFAEECHPSTVRLSLADGAILAESDGFSAAIDLVPTRCSPPEFRPRRVSASAVVPIARFRRVIGSARTLPTGASEKRWVPPPMWLRFESPEVLVHVDWTEVTNGRATYRIEAGGVEGSGTVSLSHSVLGTFLEGVPEVDDDLRLAIGTDERLGDAAVLWMASADWELTTFTRDALDERWADRIRELCDDEDWPVREKVGHEWVLEVDGSQVHLSVQHGHPDLARVSVVVAVGLDDSGELFRELNSLNMASAGRRFLFDDGTVHVLADVRLSEFDALRASIVDVCNDAAHYAPLLQLHTTAG